MIVVDTNILTYFWIPGPMASLADRLVEKDTEWHVPLLWRSEFSNVISLHIKLHKISLEDGMIVLQKSMERLRKNEHESNHFKALELSATSGCTTYDCEFIALAIDLNTPLITTDAPLIKSFPKIAIHLKTFVE